MMGYHYTSVDDAFKSVCKDFYDDPVIADGMFHSEKGNLRSSWVRETMDDSSPDRGKPMLEKSIMLEIENPRHRLVYAKDTDIFNYVGQWIYLMGGSEHVDPISFYNPIARRFVDEGVDPVRLRASWGSRLFGNGNVERLIDLLNRSPHTRRAVLTVFAAEDLAVSSRNLPCLVSMQFVLQGGKLNCFTTMRSQAAVGVMPYDLFILTMLHEYVAMKTNMELGTYTHFAPVCGVRVNEIPILRKVVGVGPTHAESMPEMSELQPGQLALFHASERAIRRNKRAGDYYTLPHYWQSFLMLAIVKESLNLQLPYFNEGIFMDGGSSAFPRSYLEKAAASVKYSLANPR